jgi:hypothetical protein
LTCDASEGIDLASLPAIGATTRSHHELLIPFARQRRGANRIQTLGHGDRWQEDRHEQAEDCGAGRESAK